MNGLLLHRGPGYRSIFSSENVGMGFRSLQYEPFFGHDSTSGGTPVIHAFDGYVWNAEELGKAAGCTVSPEESFPVFLTALYNAGGFQYSAGLHGPYSSALYDPEREHVILSRSITGQRTLYYVQTDAFFAFASEIKALLSLPGVDTEIDEESFRWYLARAYIPHPRTIFKGIRQLNPGARLLYDIPGDSFRITEPDMREGRIPSVEDRPEEFFVDRLDQLLTSAIEKQVSAINKPIGCFLTGGVDTSLVASILSKVASGKIQTFVVGFDDTICDERPRAAAIADHLGTDHRSYLFDAEDFVALTHTLYDIHDEPFSDLGSAVAYYGTTLARQHTDIVFTGAASDFLFGNFDMAHVYNYYQLPQWVRRVMITMGKPFFNSPKIRRRFPNMPLMTYLGGGSFFETFFTKWSNREIASLTGCSLDVKDDFFYKCFMALEGLELSGRIQKTLYSTYSTDSIDRVFERSCMFNSLQTVNPYLDSSVFSFANHLPDSLKYRKGYGKLLNRRLLQEKYLPDSYFKHAKRGTSLPFGETLFKPMNDLIDRYLSHACLRRTQLFRNLDVVDNAVSAYRSGEYGYGDKLWTLIVFQIWFERTYGVYV